MKTRPKALVIVPCALVVIAFMMPVQIMLLYGHGFGEMESVLHKLTPMNWLVMGLCLTAAYRLFHAMPSARLTLPLLMGAVILNNVFVGTIATDYTPLTTSLATFGFLTMMLPVLTHQIQDLLKNPHRRWWLSRPRASVETVICVNQMKGATVTAKTFDLSESGAFIPFEVPECGFSAEDLRHVTAGEKINVRINIGTLRQLRCDAEVVRTATPGGRYPSGLGIKFVDLSRHDRRELASFICQEAMV